MRWMNWSRKIPNPLSKKTERELPRQMLGTTYQRGARHLGQKSWHHTIASSNYLVLHTYSVLHTSNNNSPYFVYVCIKKWGVPISFHFRSANYLIGKTRLPRLPQADIGSYSRSCGFKMPTSSKYSRISKGRNGLLEFIRHFAIIERKAERVTI